jgi:anti-anti-sigma regulatory factor
MPPRNRHRPVGRLDRTGPRTVRARDIGPALHGREPAGPFDYQLAVHGDLVVAVRGQLDHATAAQLRLAITAARDGYANPYPLDPAATTLRDAIGLGALVIGCLTCADIDVRVTVDDPSPLLAQLLYLAGIPTP